MTERQRQFEFTFKATQRLSRSLRFPTWFEMIESGRKRKISSTAVRSVLQRIEDHAGLTGWSTCTNETLAGESSVTISQTKRAIRMLDDETLIIIRVERQGRSKTKRKIRPNWQGFLDSPFCSLDPEQKANLIQELCDSADQVGGGIQKAKEENDQSFNHNDRREVGPWEGGGRSLSAGRSVPGAPRSVPVGDREVFVLEDFVLEDFLAKTRKAAPVPKRSSLRVFAENDFDGSLIDRVIELVAQVPFDLTKPDDWNFAYKVASLVVLGAWPEEWFFSSLESVRSKEVGFGYWVAIFRKRCEATDSDLGKELARVFLPHELQFAQIKTTSFSESLCRNTIVAPSCDSFHNKS